MGSQQIEQVFVPGVPVPLTFDPALDLLGSGTVGEVFQVTIGQEHGTFIKVRALNIIVRFNPH